jgi:hypothetical protein
MARTTQQIFDSMLAEAISLATTQGNTDAIAMFGNTSKVAIWRLLLYIQAFAIMTFEKLLDVFGVLVDDKIATLKPGKLSWYRQKAKDFQFGFPLYTETDVFDNTGFTDTQIAASKIIAYAACTETTLNEVRVVLIKVAKLNGTDLVPLATIEYNAFEAYMQDYVKFAGTTLIIYNQVADLLKAEVDVYYNPLLLDGNGFRTDAVGYPVRDAATLYPTQLEFDGEFTNAGFIDALQACYGVSRRKVNLKSMQRKTANGAYSSVGSSFIPFAGYCKFDTDGLVINYIADV